ncbi:MAG: hypothetical protein WD355_04000 [Balneolaceae bacterium]
MLKPMFGHRPKPKKFDLPLRYYDPKKEERRKQRIRIRTNRRRPKQGLRVFMFAAGLAMVVWIISLL